MELEDKLEASIRRKQEFLEQHGFRELDPAYQDLTHEIEHLEHRINRLREEIPKDPKYFTGIAFVSFHTEKDKRLVILHNTHTLYERITSYLNNGRLGNITEHDLTWD